MPQFCILHLSDLHISNLQEPSYARLRSELIEDLKQNILSPNHLSLDAVTITGDLVDRGGEKKKFDTASCYIDELCEKLGISLEQIIIVPGNHDFTRDKMLEYYMQNKFPSEDNKQLYDHALKIISPRFEPYTQFLKEKMSTDYPLYSYGGNVSNLKRPQGSINFIQLDSAWSTTGTNEYGHLLIGKWQLEGICKTLEELPKSDLKLALMHHPIDWFEHDQKQMLVDFFEQPKLLDIDALLCGHIHESKAEAQLTPDGALIQLASGLGYPNADNRTSGLAKLANCRYSVYRFDTTVNKIECWIRKSNTHGMFVSDTELYSAGGNDGHFHINYKVSLTPKKTDDSSSELQEIRNIWQQRLEEIRKKRIGFNTIIAWKEIKEVLDDASSIPNDLKSEYYMVAARWAIDDYDTDEEAEKYLKRALLLNPNVEVDTYNALKLTKSKQFDEAILGLGEIDSDRKLCYIFHTLIYALRGQQAEAFLKTTKFSMSLESKYLLALCHIQAKNLNKAILEMESVLIQCPTNPGYYLAMGQALFWKGIPSDLHDSSICVVQFANGLFTPDTNAADSFKKALYYFEIAEKYAQNIDNNEIKNGIEESWILTAQFLPEFRAEADRRAIQLLTKEPGRVFVFSYAIEMGLELDEELHLQPIRKLVCTKDNLINHTLLLIQFTNDFELLENKEIEFLRQGYRAIWLRQKILLLLTRNDIIGAKDLLNSEELDGATKELLMLAILEKEGLVTELLDLAEISAKKLNNRMNCSNWALLSHKHKKYKNQMNAAKYWLESFPDSHAVELLAEAQLANKLYNDALETLDNNLVLFVGQAITLKCKQIQYHALWQLGKTPNALDIANDLWKHIKDDRLLLDRVKLCLGEGDRTLAISYLRDALEEGVKSPDVFFMIAQLLLVNDPDEAMRYSTMAKDQYSHLPEAYTHAFIIANRAGYEEEAGKILSEFLSKFPDNNQFKAVSINEFLDKTSQWSKDSDLRWQAVNSAKLPKYLVLDLENKNLVGDFYWRWFSNSEQLPSRVTFPICYGDMEKDHTLQSLNINLFMDYSACLVAHTLNLYSVITSSFDKVYISPNLLSTIEYEIGQISTNQPTQLDREKRLLTLLKQLPIEIIEVGYAEINADPTISELPPIDHAKLMLARQYNAKIVTETFSFEIYESQGIPELEICRIFPSELIKALVIKGEIIQETFQEHINDARIRNSVVEELLTESPILIVDAVLLEQLLEQNVLEITSNTFKLVIPSLTLEPLKQNIDISEKRLEAKQFLKKLSNKLTDLKHKGKIEFGQMSDIKDKGGLLTQALYDMFTFAENKDKLAIWCDDRFVNRYINVGNTPILSAFQILESLLQQNKLDESTYLEKIHILLTQNAQFHIPLALYIIRALEKANFDPKVGRLQENRWLKGLRRNLADSLSKQSIIVSEIIGPDRRRPELYGYLLKLQITAQQVITSIWLLNQDISWKESATNWVVSHYFDTLADIPYLIKANISNPRPIAQKEAHLFLNALSILEHSTQSTELYLKWLYRRLNANWHHYPSIKKETSQIIIKCLTDILVQSINGNNNEFYKNIVCRFIDLLPVELCEACYNDFKLRHLLGGLTTTIVLKNTPFIVEETAWYEWIERAVDRGVGVSGNEMINDQKVTVTLTGDELWNQSIIIDWVLSEHQPTRNIFHEPLVYLLSSSHEKREKWFDLAKPYLTFISDIRELVFNISPPNSVSIEKLHNRLEQDSKFFFDRARIFLQDKTEFPDIRCIFPPKPNLFSNELPAVPKIGEDTQAWCTQCKDICEKLGYERLLDNLSCLPLGNKWEFAKVILNLVDEGVIEKKLVLQWIDSRLTQTVNPVKQQNICRLLLLDHSNKERITDILMVQTQVIGEIENPIYEWYKLYIVLLKFSWKMMDYFDDYKEIDTRQKIMWCYIYGDRMVSCLNELLKKNVIEHTPNVIASAFERNMNNISKLRHPLDSLAKAYIDVTHPEHASIYRTVLGGCLDVLSIITSTDTGIIAKFSPVLVQLNQINLLPDDGGFEQVLFFLDTINSFDSWLNKNVKVHMQNLLNAWGQNVEIFDLKESGIEHLTKAIDEEIDTDTILGYLFCLSTQQIPVFLADLVVEVINKIKFNSKMNDVQMNTWGQIKAIIITALPEPHQNKCMEAYLSELNRILLHHPKHWKLIMGFLLTLFASEDYNSSASKLLEALRTVMINLDASKIPTEFLNYLCDLSFCMPHEVAVEISSIRREISRIH